jgi:hypothetical protein
MLTSGKKGIGNAVPAATIGLDVVVEKKGAASLEWSRPGDLQTGFTAPAEIRV